MCKAGNDSIFKECRDRILKEVAMERLSNQAMHAILVKHGGCMVKPLDKKKGNVLELALR